jgi:hypothetical protein
MHDRETWHAHGEFFMNRASGDLCKCIRPLHRF